MMDQEKWTKLKQTFDTEELFWENGTWCDANELDFDIMEWLECDSTCPSGRMIQEFREHGYSVYPTDRDSFGWLVGAVADRRTKKEIIFG